MNKRSVSIVIPNYNGRQLLANYLPFTIAAAEQAKVPFEIIIVDDCSADDSVAFLNVTYPQIKLLENNQNKGFSISCNRGIGAAAYELILLLNSDVKLTPDYFEAQWKYFDRTDTFGVMGRIIDMEGDHIQDAARVPGFNGFKLKTDYFYYTSNNNDWLYTLYLSGANALIDAAKLNAIGGFNQLFSPFYSEDMDLSLRAWRLNWKCYYEHHAICRHRVSASTRNYKTAAWVKSIYYRNRFFIHAIHLNGLARLAWFLQITLVDLIPKLIVGRFWLYKSYVDLIKNRKAIRLSRQHFNQTLDQHNSTTSLQAVVEIIIKSVKDKKLTRFKP